MAKGNQALAAEMKHRDELAWQQQQQAMQQAATPTPAETQAEADRKAYFDWKAKGDYRTPPPGLIGVNYGPEAQRRRAMEQTATPTGAAGMGAAYASPTALAMTRDYLGNVNAESDATAYQSALTDEDLYQRTGNSVGLMNLGQQRNMGILGDTSNMSQFMTGARIQTTPKPWTETILPALLSGAMGAAGSFLGGPAFGAMMKH